MPERILIARDAKIIHDHGWRAYSTQNHAERFHGSFKPELYAISTVLIDQIMQTAAARREQYPPFGLPPRNLGHLQPTRLYFQRKYPFDELYEQIPAAMRRATEATFDEIEKTHDDNMYPLLQRFKELVDLRRHITGYKNEYVKFIMAGFGTATHVMLSITDALPRIFYAKNIELDPDVLIQTAHNTLPIILGLSTNHILDFLRIHRALKRGYSERRPGYNADLFDLVSVHNDQYKLIIPHQDKLRAMIGEEIVPSPHVGCPAGIKVNSSTSIEKLWDWIIDLAEPIYRSRYQK